MSPTKAEVDPRELQQQLAQNIARRVVRWGLTVPAILFLEMHRPLNFVASQMLLALSPIVSIVARADELNTLAKMLERRESTEELVVAIEAAQAEADRARAARTTRP